ncbi:MAG: ATP-binding cassette domain-containing protein [Anaerolineaceae bacterium]|nr:MAG: ATP-binding cassette domain-containing protein [Anaerolineaceae bacterium]
MNPLIEINDLQIKRNERVALEVERLSIPRGETLTVVGPNGAGKSTLLQALANLIRPARGEIRFGGIPLCEWNDLDYRRKIAFVFQSPLLMDMTVEQNVALGLKFRGMAREQVHARAREWMSRLGIESLSKRRASQLSGGEAQRVSLARAFVLDPELLLLDEPFAALDPPTHASLLDELSSLLAEDHRTAIFVTHNLKEAARVGSRVAVIVGGKLKQVGTPRQVKSHPVDEDVAVFLKEMQD